MSPSAEKAMPQRWALGVQYMGAAYAGWQVQPDQSTVQGVLEQALSEVANQSIEVVCAGRTDSGVHALQQVVHFEAPCERIADSWMRGANRYLPTDVKVLWAHPVAADFHARYSAQSRCYRYLILQSTAPQPLWHGRVNWHPRQLDCEAMQQAAQVWLGEHDFSSFRGADCQSNTPIRQLDRIEIQAYGELVVIGVEANAFLHHMVRNLVGALLRVGRAERSLEWARQLLEARSRKAGDYVMAEAQGLYLYQVAYPSEYGLPQLPHALFTLA